MGNMSDEESKKIGISNQFHLRSLDGRFLDRAGIWVMFRYHFLKFS